MPRIKRIVRAYPSDATNSIHARGILAQPRCRRTISNRGSGNRSRSAGGSQNRSRRYTSAREPRRPIRAVRESPAVLTRREFCGECSASVFAKRGADQRGDRSPNVRRKLRPGGDDPAQISVRLVRQRWTVRLHFSRSWYMLEYMPSPNTPLFADVFASLHHIVDLGIAGSNPVAHPSYSHSSDASPARPVQAFRESPPRVPRGCITAFAYVGLQPDSAGNAAEQGALSG